MPIHINIVCAVADCQTCIAGGFDDKAETFGTLLTALEGAGWYVGPGDRNDRILVRCPEHAAELTPKQTAAMRR